MNHSLLSNKSGQLQGESELGNGKYIQPYYEVQAPPSTWMLINISINTFSVALKPKLQTHSHDILLCYKHKQPDNAKVSHSQYIQRVVCKKGMCEDTALKC